MSTYLEKICLFPGKIKARLLEHHVHTGKSRFLLKWRAEPRRGESSAPESENRGIAHHFCDMFIYTMLCR